MATGFSAARLVRRLLREHASLLAVLGQRARDAVKFSAMPLVYANAAQPLGPSPPPPPAGTGDAAAAAVLDKERLNRQIPLKPVYIAPRNPVVLCHGLYGFDVKGPEKLPMLQVHYWRGIREALENIGARVVVARVSGTGGVRERAHQLDSLLASRLESANVNIIGHSMGGLDARYLITHISPKSYTVASLTTVCTPHRGSPFMDWCRDYLGLGYRVDPDQLIRDFSMIWRPSAAGTNPMGDTPGSANTAAMPGVPEAVLRERINSIICRAMGSDGPATGAQDGVLLGSAGAGPQHNTIDIDPASARLQEFAHFLTRLLGENASAGETSQLASLARTSAIKDDYLGRSMALLRMVYRRIMATLDTPAYACLTTDYCQRFFNPATPNVPGVDYLSIGAHMDPADISDKINPLIIPHDIIYKAEGPNDGFVSLTSAQWGHYLGSVCADHFDFTNRWRLTSVGRDFIGTVMYWSGKWSSWASHGGHVPGSASDIAVPPARIGDVGSRPSAFGAGSLLGAGPGGSSSSRSRFDPIDFYLRIGTILYQRGL
ncbi:hypothetical protein LPJ61_005839 [Coemansia biformis]|uniref:GPI inositol-deacylase n=1 Tax=Coemansia biformis TaxID=1286918 RepID=A0A9W7Y3H7_9FUNG|nr:hypothetical protein LPJ61_005839 [Coemansia biformis]